MAVQVESRGQLQEFLGILRRRKWQVILPALFVVTIGTAFAVLVPKKYLIKTQVELRPISVSVSNKEGGNAPYQIKAGARIRKVVQELANTSRGAAYLALQPEEQADFIEDIQEDLKVTPGTTGSRELGANFIGIEYADVDAQWGVTFLKALRQDWIQDVLELDRNKVLDEQKTIQEEAVKLDKQIAREEEQLTELKRLNGISATQPIPGAQGIRGEDPQYESLQRNKSLLDKIELDRVVAQTEADELEKRLVDLPTHLSQEALVGGSDNAAELQSIELELLDVEALLKKYRPQHHKYREAVDKKTSLQERREQVERLITRATTQTTTVENPERAVLRKQIDARKVELAKLDASRKRLLEEIQHDEESVSKLHEVYAQVRERASEIERLRVARGAAELQYQGKVQAVKILSSPLSNPFQITQDVYAPAKATEPNPWLIVAFSVIAGLAIGVGWVVLVEYSKNCFRSVNDINRVMVVPVLGSIDTIVTRREARLAGARRAIVGMSTAAVLGAVAFVTWAWARDPDLLSPDLRAKIEVFRSNFR